MSSTPFFLPAVVQEFDTGEIMSNLLSALPYFFAVILLNVNSRHSDMTKERPYHIIGNSLTNLKPETNDESAMCAIGIFGYILVLIGFLQKWGKGARMVAVVIAVAGQWSAMTPFMAWISDYVSVCTLVLVFTCFRCKVIKQLALQRSTLWVVLLGGRLHQFKYTKKITSGIGAESSCYSRQNAKKLQAITHWD